MPHAKVSEELSAKYASQIFHAPSAEEALKAAHAMIVITDWEHFSRIDMEEVSSYIYIYRKIDICTYLYIYIDIYVYLYI